jgi:hypothetical protein
LIESILLEIVLPSWRLDGNVIFEMYGAAANNTLRINKNTVKEHRRALACVLLRLKRINFARPLSLKFALGDVY